MPDNSGFFYTREPEPGTVPKDEEHYHRKVYEHGKVIRDDSFFTRYTPQNPTTVYGPGGKPPGPFFYLPSSS